MPLRVWLFFCSPQFNHINPVQETWGSTWESPGEGYEDGEGSGALLNEGKGCETCGALIWRGED